jgi:hypothetical protein
MPRRLARKLMLSITVIVIIVAAVSGLVNVTTEERQLLDTMIVGADQLSKGIASATWHAMLDDHREAAYQVMQTIAAKQGIDGIRMFNRAGQVMFSTNSEDKGSTAEPAPEVNPDLPSAFSATPTADAAWPWLLRFTTSPPAARRNVTPIPPK